MNIVSANFTELLSEYWYIAVPVTIFTVALIAAVSAAIAKGIKKIGQNAEIKRALKKEEQLKALRAEAAKARLEEDKTFDDGLSEETEEAPDNLPEEQAVTSAEEERETLPQEEISPAVKLTEKKPKKAVYRVIYDSINKEWTIKKDGAQRVIRRVKTKAEALKIAARLAETQNLSLTVHTKDGKFQKKKRYGK